MKANFVQQFLAILRSQFRGNPQGSYFKWTVAVREASGRNYDGEHRRMAVAFLGFMAFGNILPYTVMVHGQGNKSQQRDCASKPGFCPGNESARLRNCVCQNFFKKALNNAVRLACCSNLRPWFVVQSHKRQHTPLNTRDKQRAS